MVGRTLNAREREVLKKASNIIRRKLVLLGQRARANADVSMPVTLLELKDYESGRKQVPLNRLALLLRFYGCSEERIGHWNVILSSAIYKAMENARNT